MSYLSQQMTCIFDIGTKNYAEVSGKEIEQRDALVSAIKKKKETFKIIKKHLDI